MSRTATSTVSHKVLRPTALGSAAPALTLTLATLTTGLVAGVFYAYAISVNLGLAAQPDESYVTTMQAINEKIQNPLFFASFFGAVLSLLAALAVHYPRPRSGRFWLVALACALYIGGGFLLTAFVNVPMNEQLAGDGPVSKLCAVWVLGRAEFCASTSYGEKDRVPTTTRRSD